MNRWLRVRESEQKEKKWPTSTWIKPCAILSTMVMSLLRHLWRFRWDRRSSYGRCRIFLGKRVKRRPYFFLTLTTSLLIRNQVLYNQISNRAVYATIQNAQCMYTPYVYCGQLPLINAILMLKILSQPIRFLPPPKLKS